ncbi:MAG TPA: sugar ABC transporter permease [Solirubrobacteraceae bacterium]|jgi:D-xylose transport system permease protein
MSAITPPLPTAAAAPRATIGAYARRWAGNVRGGELGSLPIIVGLLIIAVVFQVQNDRFLTAGNFVNLMVQGAAYALVAMGIVFVLLLGEIDLSVGYVSGVAGVLTALLLLPDGSTVPTSVAILAALGSGVLIGTLHGLVITKIGIPSFVVTLAGLLAWNGVVLLLIGTRGTVVLQDSFVIGFANDFVPKATAWILLVVAVAGFAVVQVLGLRQRAKAGLENDPPLIVALRVLGLFVALAAVVSIVNQDRGLPYVALLVGALLVFWTYVLRRTRFGRHVYAVGGNAEAARRAGIDVDRIRIACFAICSLMAAVGGIVLASRLRSVDTNAGGGAILLYSIAAAVIGGTSLFGGRGHIKAALLGALVIASIDNGLGLLGLSSGTKFVVTGCVLLLAVAVDSISRRGREQSGRA